MELLSVNIATGVVTPVARYYFSLPTAWAHTSHKVPEFLRPGGWANACTDTAKDTLKQTRINTNMYTHAHAKY